MMSLINLELKREDLEFIHYVIQCLRDESFNELNYYRYVRDIEKKREIYKRCNDILVMLVEASKKEMNR